jgi:hypothetical protein
VRPATDVLYLSLANVQIGDDGLRDVARCFPNLAVIDLRGTPTTIEGILAHLPACCHLVAIFHGEIPDIAGDRERVAAAFPPGIDYHDFWSDAQ